MKEHHTEFGLHGGPRGLREGRGHHRGGCRSGSNIRRALDVAANAIAELGLAAEEGQGTTMHHGRGGRDRDGLGGGRGRSRGPLEQGDLRWLVLDLIALQPRHGYEIIKAIEDMLNGRYSPSPGIVYPTLTFLEETGMLASEPQASKKLYTITEEGQAELDSNAESVQAVRARIEAYRGRFGGPPAPEMIRAMDNLRAAIQIRWSKGNLSPESLAAITAAIDRAAGEIERS